jgi:hypothetical protein
VKSRQALLILLLPLIVLKSFLLLLTSRNQQLLTNRNQQLLTNRNLLLKATLNLQSTCPPQHRQQQYQQTITCRPPLPRHPAPHISRRRRRNKTRTAGSCRSQRK